MIKYKTIKAYKTSRPTQIRRLLRCGKGQNERWVYQCHFHDNRNKSFDVHLHNELDIVILKFLAGNLIQEFIRGYKNFSLRNFCRR